MEETALQNQILYIYNTTRTNRVLYYEIINPYNRFKITRL